jgi:hypothetical protein
MRPSQKTPETITTIGIDVGKNTFHLVGLDKRRNRSAAEGVPSSTRTPARQYPALVATWVMQVTTHQAGLDSSITRLAKCDSPAQGNQPTGNLAA